LQKGPPQKKSVSGQARLARMYRQWFTSMYVIGDMIAVIFTWIVFFGYRKMVEGKPHHLLQLFEDERLVLGLLGLPVAWCVLFWLSGTYHMVYRKTATGILWNSFATAVLGAILLLLTVMTDDEALTYRNYLHFFSVLLAIQFTSLLIIRYLLWSTVNFIRNRNGLGTVSVILYQDASARAAKSLDLPNVYSRTEQMALSLYIRSGLYFDGQRPDIYLRHLDDASMRELTSKLGWHMDLFNIYVHESIIPLLKQPLQLRSQFQKTWLILSTTILPQWKKNVKRSTDVVFSIVALVLLLPIFLLIGIVVVIDAGFPIFYSQERVGYKGKAFRIFKFRTMIRSAEKDGPLLSYPDDTRITHSGQFLRKWRLDELPQFYNVILGDMSLVGPRPERRYFIDQIKNKVPNYQRIFMMRPGITSWGQVKYGYASSVSEIVQRVRYDLLYVNNASLLLDLQIIYQTILVLLKGKGQ
jgi:lipopolysaccharide/colanic/teichoic acid biosynthesis glycosyltransferase